LLLQRVVFAIYLLFFCTCLVYVVSPSFFTSVCSFSGLNISVPSACVSVHASALCQKLTCLYRQPNLCRIHKTSALSSVVSLWLLLLQMIDEVHTLIGAGAAEGAIDAANILKPALARGELQCIGATTLDEYRKHIEKDPALERFAAAST